MIHGPMNVELIDVKQSNKIYQYRNIKRKLYKTNVKWNTHLGNLATNIHSRSSSPCMIFGPLSIPNMPTVMNGI